jgi:hypothetical protein
MRAKFHTLVFLGFTAVAATSLAGCTVDNRSDPPPVCTSNALFLTWSIDDGVNNLTCDQVGAAWVDVAAAGVVSEFPCSALSGQTFDEPGGRYNVSVQLLSPSRGAVYSQADNVFNVPSCGGLNIGNVAFLVN